MDTDTDNDDIEYVAYIEPHPAHTRYCCLIL